MPDVIGYGITGFLVWLLVLSAWHKFRSPAYYSELVGDYLRGLQPGRPLVYAVGAVEALSALLMLLPATRTAGLAACTGLLLAYALLMLVRLASGRRDLRCGCAGPASDVNVSPALVLRNMVCVALAVAAIQLAPVPVGPLVTGLLALSVAVFLTIMYLGVEQLISNAQRIAQGF